ncbi:molybdate ABC transporter substrate-binding protein [Candidatus Cetobacterium colombiensis]|uniref:Molybdate ABC transporter substrate-binding protein n=1 Tax=Candidatus Cetobacterium colombiensis TaxID=3073100 RepID=A0ABU4W831_9FUSO|nr:molybdate ABC transporter substrate-binding protein [Candidatus Cetobacterium colombiensis]MDX8335673.1 molybdate ABC transporter substrate-binding protein [Candidatus Cetobacterium colombiensis]
MYKVILIFFILIQSIFSKEILISGAASLKEYLEKNINEYKKINPDLNISLNLGGSGTLKRQLEQGGNVDIIFLANREYMIDLKENNYIYNEDVILENSLALIKNKKSTLDKNIILAIGDPKYVPAGQYSIEVLNSLPLKDYSLVYGKDVRSVLSYVELGEADYGIVYLTDTKILKNSEVIQVFSKTLHKPIEYSIGISKDSKNKKEAEDFINFLKGKDWND